MILILKTVVSEVMEAISANKPNIVDYKVLEKIINYLYDNESDNTEDFINKMNYQIYIHTNEDGNLIHPEHIPEPEYISEPESEPIPDGW